MSTPYAHSRSWLHLSTRSAATIVALGCLALLPERLAAQPARAANDSTHAANQVYNEFAVLTSGVWIVDGEYKGTSGEYNKLTGYFAFVTSTPTSKDEGNTAVLAMYLEPMAGGPASWLGVQLSCRMTDKLTSTQCVPLDGAKGLLDLNFLIKGIPTRGKSVDVEIAEPDVKSIEKRFTSRSTSRGRFTLKAPE